MSGSNIGQTNSTSYQSYYNKKNMKQISPTSQYYRLFLFRDLLSCDGKVVYIVEHHFLNEVLWSRTPLYRGNGVVTIGVCISVVNLLPINSYWCNEIPIVETRGSCFIVKSPDVMVSVPINMGVMKKTTRSFVINNAQIKSLSLDVHSTKCSGLFCDKKRVIELRRSNKGCGCYSMSNRIGNIVLVHQIVVNCIE